MELFIPQRGHLFVPQKSYLFVPLKGLVVCPSKRATCLSLKKGYLFVPQEGLLVCPSIKDTHLSLNMGYLFVPQRGLLVCICLKKDTSICPPVRPWFSQVKLWYKITLLNTDNVCGTYSNSKIMILNTSIHWVL